LRILKMRRRTEGVILWLTGLLAFAPTATADSDAVEHEPIAPNAAEDVALGVRLDSALAPSIRTAKGVFEAPDMAQSVDSASTTYDHTANDRRDSVFHPDRDTRRPNLAPYEDPFTPSTAPWKRDRAFDHVDVDYTLIVRDLERHPLAIGTKAVDAAVEDEFFADLVVDVSADQAVRIPSVGPGARIVRAHAVGGKRELSLRYSRDGAENWYVESDIPTRARVVLQLAIPKAAFGGEFGNPTWTDLQTVAKLPPCVAKAANAVATVIGVSRRKAPRDAVTRLVSYFREFSESSKPLPPSKDIYLDIALEKKGVCRHRAFAFLVTALQLGIPTRMVTNDTHAWVEVHDGRLWRRIDLGGAGSPPEAMRSSATPPAHAPHDDPFAWPKGATPGEQLSGLAQRTNRPHEASSSSSGSGPASKRPGARPTPEDPRPPTTTNLTADGSERHRGSNVNVHGDVSAAGLPCGRLVIEIGLRPRDGKGPVVRVGKLATDDRGHFDGTLTVPTSMAVGDYEFETEAHGNERCAPSALGDY
jgi:transglutaminase-like putative cysteine protease